MSNEKAEQIKGHEKKKLSYKSALQNDRLQGTARFNDIFTSEIFFDIPIRGDSVISKVVLEGRISTLLLAPFSVMALETSRCERGGVE